MDTIHLKLSTTCIVGILPLERIEPQPVELTVAMGLDLEPCGDDGTLEASVNYASVDTALRFLCEHGRFWLIESLSLAILRWILLESGPDEARGHVQLCRVRIDKPAVMPGSAPGVELERTSDWCTLPRRPLSPGVVGEVLIEVPEVVAWRAVREPGASWPKGGARLQISERVSLIVEAREAT